MGMSPSRMPQTQGIMGSHANNMVSQQANQGQFLQQGQFPVSAGGAMNVNIGLGPAMSQASVTQVRKMLRFFLNSPRLFIAHCLFLFKYIIFCV